MGKIVKVKYNGFEKWYDENDRCIHYKQASGYEHSSEYDDKGNEVTSWVSDGTPYIIEGLSTDREYELKELEAPNGYHLLEDVFKFNVGNSEETKEIKVENEKIKVQKQKVLPKTGFQ